MSELDFADLLWEKIDFEDQDRYDEYIPSKNDWFSYAALDLLGIAPNLGMLSASEKAGENFAGEKVQ